MKRKIIIDCDPGQDDAIALLLAFAASDALDLLGITCVAGNVGLPLTFRNALKLRELVGRHDVPVFAGCPRPILRLLETAEHVHGETGLNGVDLPEPSISAERRHAVDFLIETCRSAGPDGLTLCTIGPMTNIATALVMAPDIGANIAEIAFMGGAALGPGNITPAAEFNIFVDPHAARVVLESGVRTTMFGLEVTHKALATPARRAAIDVLDTPSGRAASQILAYYDRTDIEKYGDAGAPLHDPCVIAYVLAPKLFDGRNCHATVSTEDGPALGRTVVDWWGRSEALPNCRVITEIDANGFFDLLTERLGQV
ncbi:MAG: nucleoside hydrolase [Pseudomonadota bacterium]|nr:nucleoside hydrolase [Pseudomonadota bacterium]